ncbi:type II TA system antitoxin MqsA family protein [Pseudomonas sp. XK-1]|uniref:type II TA system antitoxin MqsA family protein n=1 Tax=Pseudomonas sp. XK-1 TaxID=3136019 RepID=UPI00311A16D5
MKCPICESKGTLREKVSIVKVRPIPDIHIDVQLSFLHCSYCNEEIETPKLLQANDETIRRTKILWLAKHADDPNVFPTLLKLLRNSLGVSQKRFSEAIGATGNTISKYEQGEISPSSIAKKLIILIAHQPSIFQTLIEINDALLTPNNDSAYCFSYSPLLTTPSWHRTPSSLEVAIVGEAHNYISNFLEINGPIHNIGLDPRAVACEGLSIDSLTNVTIVALNEGPTALAATPLPLDILDLPVNIYPGFLQYAART